MKKFSLLLSLCLAALMVPQRVIAAYTTGWDATNKVLTITTDAAGQLSRSAFADYYTAEKIILNGYFNSSDLEAIKAIDTGDNVGFNNVKEVDMRAAHIVTSSSAGGAGEYYLFHDEASGTYSTGDKAIENVDKLYIWANTIGWQPTSAPANESEITLYENDDAMQAVKGTSTLNSYAAYPTTTNHYLSLTITGESWGSMSTVDPGNAQTVDWDENSRASHLAEFANGKTIKTKRYYTKQAAPNGLGWVLRYPTSSELEGKTQLDGAGVNADITLLNPTLGSSGDYLFFYVYYTKTNGSWGNMSMNDPGNAGDTQSWLENELSSHLSYYQDGQSVKLKRYYQLISVDYEWAPVDAPSKPLPEGVTEYDGDLLGADMTNLFRSYANVGDYLSFDVYYTKSESREWQEIASPSSDQIASAIEVNFPYEYRNNHLTNYNRDDVVKMSEYSYYQLTSGSGAAGWQEIAFNDGDKYNISFRATLPETLPTKSDIYPSPGNYGLDLKSTGLEKVYDGTTWVAAGSPVDNYREMKFSYWSGSLEKATTSQYADTNIPSEIFQNCEKLTEVNYLSGNVTGFGDHQSPTYAAFKVNIGKDVTSIDAAAFRRANITDITFIDNYTAEEKSAAAGYFASPSGDRPVYPKELTIGDEAFMNCTNLKGITIPNRVISIGTDAFHLAGNDTDEFKVDFERRSSTLGGSTVAIAFDHDLVIGNGCFNQCYKLKELSLPIRLVSLGNMAFADTPNLKNVDIREDFENARIKTITSNAFLRSGLTSIKIPRSVTEIQAGAFQECFNIETVKFQEQVDENGDPLTVQEPLIIRSGAFAGGTESSYKLKSVIVDIDPKDRLLVCEYNAFNFTSLVGQTNEASRQMAVLDFPDEDWDYYQGDWKKGYAFSQSNLNLFKDGIDRATSQPTVKSEGLVSVLDNEPRNGWQQFAMSTTDREIVIPEGNYIRTYSTATPHYIPIIAGTGTYLYDIFRISAFDDGYKEGDDINSSETAAAATRVATAKKLTDVISSRQYVPANTGLIMQIHGNSNDSYIVYQEEVPSASQTAENGYKEYTYPENSTSDKNLLWPSCVDVTVSVTEDKVTVDKVVINPTEPYPLSGSGDRFRIFGLWVEDNAFWRSEPGVLINPDMAYLKLPTTIFHWANEQQGTSYSEDTGGGSRIALVFSDDDSETTSIGKLAVAKNSNDNCYTIQGVKLSRPQGKGLYIVNGKKVFVK